MTRRTLFQRVAYALAGSVLARTPLAGARVAKPVTEAGFQLWYASYGPHGLLLTPNLFQEKSSLVKIDWAPGV